MRQGRRDADVADPTGRVPEGLSNAAVAAAAGAPASGPLLEAVGAWARKVGLGDDRLVALWAEMNGGLDKARLDTKKEFSFVSPVS